MNSNLITAYQNMMQEIERLAKAGFALHWLHPRSKAPIGNDWSDKPVAGWAKLKDTYKPGNNVGARLGKWSVVGEWFLHVFDMDVRDSDLRDEAFDTLQGMFPSIDISKVPTVISGSGGASRHFYILTDQPFRGRKLAHSEGFTMVWDAVKEKDVKKWDWEIELFGTGKQVALPPSIHPDTGKPYRWSRQFDFDDLELGIGPIVDSAAIEALGGFSRDAADPNDESMQPLGMSVEDVQRYLKKLPNDDLDYDEWLNVMASVQHEAMGRSAAERKQFYQAFRAWSAQSDKHDDETARYKFFSFRNRGEHRHRTMRSIVAQVRELELDEEFEDLGDTDLDDSEGQSEDGDIEFEDLGEIDESEGVPKREQKLRKEQVEHELGKKVPKRVAALNAKHAVARVSSKTVIMDFHRDGSVTYGSVDNLHSFYENDRVSTETATEPVTKAWMRNKARRSYPNGIVFAPNREVEGAYNHWQGFAVEPDPDGSCKLLLKHLKRHICKDDPVAYRYLIGWLAHLVQKPEEKPGVALVLRGPKGAGKDTVGTYIGRLFPHNYVKVQNQEQMLGKFNAHQEKCIFLHVEEGYWAGNKSADGALKFLITSTRVPIEPKGMNIFYVDSFLRLFMSSNEDWVVPATADERRYFVLDVDGSIKGDHDYFRALNREMDNGGPAALLHFLMEYDISEFEVRDVPATAALAEQKAHGLRNFPLWWFRMVQEGQIDVGMQDETGDVWQRREVRIEREEMRLAYVHWLRSRRFDGEEWSAAQIGKVWRKMLPALQEVRDRVEGVRKRFYIIPNLEKCRASFEAFIGSTFEWDEEPFIEPDEDESEFENLDE